MKLSSLLLGLHLLLGSLLPHADYAELSKLPHLYEHYQTHLQRAHGQLGFLDFLRLHYADPQHRQSENHEKLPFQHHTHACVASVFYFLPPFTFQLPLVQHPARANYCYQAVFLSSYLSSIFQPPKA